MEYARDSAGYPVTAIMRKGQERHQKTYFSKYEPWTCNDERGRRILSMLAVCKKAYAHALYEHI